MLAPSSLRPLSAMQRVRLTPLIAESTRWLAAIIILAIPTALIVPWQQTSKGSGQVIAYAPSEREQTIDAPINGRIMKWWVHEGERVAAGARIVELSDNDPQILTRLERERKAVQAQIEAGTVSLDSLRGQIASLREARTLSIAAAEAQIRMANNQVKAAEQLVEAAEATVKTAELNLTRQRALEQKGLSSRRQVELAELGNTKARTELYSARAKRAEVEGAVLARRAERERIAADMDAKISKELAELQKVTAELEKSKASLAQTEVRISRQNQMIVTAPRAGTLMHVVARGEGQFVKSGDTLATLIPDTDARAVELRVDGNDAPLVYAGRHVRLQFEGWPAVQFSGWPSVAVGTFGGKVAFVDASADRHGRFRVIIVPGEHDWPDARYLRQGVRTNGWVLLNRVSIGYEIWRQLNGFPPLGTPPAQSQEGKPGKS